MWYLFPVVLISFPIRSSKYYRSGSCLICFRRSAPTHLVGLHLDQWESQEEDYSPLISETPFYQSSWSSLDRDGPVTRPRSRSMDAAFFRTSPLKRPAADTFFFQNWVRSKVDTSDMSKQSKHTSAEFGSLRPRPGNAGAGSPFWGFQADRQVEACGSPTEGTRHVTSNGMTPSRTAPTESRRPRPRTKTCLNTSNTPCLSWFGVLRQQYPQDQYSFPNPTPVCHLAGISSFFTSHPYPWHLDLSLCTLSSLGPSPAPHPRGSSWPPYRRSAPVPRCRRGRGAPAEGFDRPPRRRDQLPRTTRPPVDRPALPATPARAARDPGPERPGLRTGSRCSRPRNETGRDGGMEWTV